ncbi:MAG: InlB B-repeat-containing protein, partial [Spirochaetota bacterium]
MKACIAGLAILLCIVFFGCQQLFSSPPTTYTIIYDGNSATSGTVPKDSNTYERGFAAEVLGNTGSLAKSGFAFSGWNTKADGTGNIYSAGVALPIGTANVTLYAVWASPASTYTITYDSNGSTGGSVPTDATSYLKGSAAPVMGNTGSLIKTSSIFAGWNTLANGTGSNYAGGAAFVIGSANVTLYAVWAVPGTTYTVTYDGNGSTGGVVPTDTNNYLMGGISAVVGNTGNLVKTSYVFSGWNTKADGTGNTYSAGSAIPIGAANVTLFAIWTQTVPVAYVNLTKAGATIEAGFTEQLGAIISPTNADRQSLTWASDKAAVATVSSVGLVTAVEPGKATITVTTSDGGKTANCAVTVLPSLIGTWISIDSTATYKSQFSADKLVTGYRNTSGGYSKFWGPFPFSYDYDSSIFEQKDSAAWMG